MIAQIFPGQGSQIKGMGRELFANFPDIVAQADQILGYSIADLCLEDPRLQLDQTQYTQPALYTVNALTSMKKSQESGNRPDFLAGHSLGEYNALLAAQVFDFATGLKLVQKRGALMSEASGGAMAAVIGLTKEQIALVLQENQLQDIAIANYNSVTQVVITGPKAAIQQVEDFFMKAGAKLFILLKVSGAFHSPLMEPAKSEFAEFIQQFTFSPPKVPVIANISAKPYEAHHIHANLIEQMTHSVLWTQTVEYLLNQGEMVFEEMGPGKVLTGLIARIRRGQ